MMIVMSMVFGKPDEHLCKCETDARKKGTCLDVVYAKYAKKVWCPTTNEAKQNG
jgi:hypothetical protein